MVSQSTFTKINILLQARKKRIDNMLFILALLVACCYSAAAQVMSLDSVLSAIRKNNPALKSAQYRAQAMNNYADGATALMAPEVGGGLWMAPYTRPSENGSKGQVMLSVQQKITNPAKLRANKNYMNSRAAIEVATESYQYNELRAQAKTAYYQGLVLHEKKNVLRENEHIITLMLKLAKLRYPYSQSKLGNIYKAEGRLQEIKNMQLMNDNSMERNIILLNQLMNVPTTNRFKIDTTTQVVPPQRTEIDTALFAHDRSDIKRIDRTIQSMRYNQQLEKYQARPDFNITYSHMIARDAGMPNQFMLLGMVTIPIAPWSSKMYKANVQGMQAEISSMESERKAMLNDLQAMTAAMVSEMGSLKQQVENYRTKILPALKRNYETLMLAYEENREELPIVIDGWEARNMAQLEYLNKLEEYFTMIVNYEKQLEE